MLITQGFQEVPSSVLGSRLTVKPPGKEEKKKKQAYILYVKLSFLASPCPKCAS